MSKSDGAKSDSKSPQNVGPEKYGLKTLLDQIKNYEKISIYEGPALAAGRVNLYFHSDWATGLAGQCLGDGWHSHRCCGCPARRGCDEAAGRKNSAPPGPPPTPGRASPGVRHC